MCRMVFAAIQRGDPQVLADCRRIAGKYEPEGWTPKSPHAINRNILHTVYMGMKTQSSPETRKRAKDLAEAINSYHLEADIDRAFNAFQDIFADNTGFTAKFEVHGGTVSTSLALQNIQARARMLFAYQSAQLLPTVRNRPGGGNLLVLGIGAQVTAK
jgi:NAD+ synthase (glutamine-hydrolysing)